MERLTLQISQALLRVCRYINQKELRCRIEAHSVYLLELAASTDIDGLEKTLTIIEQFVFLGEGIGEIQYFHGQVLHNQFSILRSLIAEIRERKRVESAIDDIFSGDYEKYTKKVNNAAIIDNAAKTNIYQKNEANSPLPSQISKRETLEGKQILSNKTWEGKNAAINRQDAAHSAISGQASPVRDREGSQRASISNGTSQAKVQDVKEPDYAFNEQNQNISGYIDKQGIQPKGLPNAVIESEISGFTHGGTWSVERQELIAQKIKELGKAAMKDLIAAFPDVSERTLRYDLQKMNDRQIIERIGSGGPASYYVVKNEAVT
ncbi:MAG: DeoR family transcriptional regulator [bacterium]|nr:DeoR family transcriptional regulator [bacterium]